jgi:hypothetical protein
MRAVLPNSGGSRPGIHPGRPATARFTGSPVRRWDVDIGAWDRIGTPDGPGMADLAGIAGVIRIGSDGAR